MHFFIKDTYELCPEELDDFPKLRENDLTADLVNVCESSRSNLTRDILA